MTNLQRRHLLTVLAASLALAFSPAAFSADRAPIPVDVTGVTDVPTLIAAIKRSAGKLLPAKLQDKEFYLAFARVFLEHARAAADLGYKIPDWILDRLPARKVILPVLGVAVFTIGSVLFAVPVETIIVAVLASIVLMAGALALTLKAIVQAI